ncbi:twin-arginine translocase TatA/TatE family subunit [Chloroflexota bacterium]
MDFFGMGPLELLLILLVALIIFGPGRLTEIAKQLGKAVRVFKQTTFDLTAQVTKEFEETKKDLKESVNIEELAKLSGESKTTKEK